MHFERFAKQSGFDGIQDSPVIHGAQRVQTGRAFGKHAVGVGLNRSLQQATQELHGHARHVTGNNKVPIGLGDLQRGVESAKRALVLDQIFLNLKPKGSIAFGLTQQSHRTGGGLHDCSDVLHQCSVPKGQQGLVTAHSGAASTGQDKAGNGILHRLTHEMMVTSPDRPGRMPVVLDNKKLYICFLAALLPLILIMLAASPMRAAERPAVSSLLTTSQDSQGKVSVVLVDRRTGKLVRSVSGPANSQSEPIRIPSPPERINALVEQSARTNGMDPLLVHSVIQVESNYNLYAVSPKGAEGLMQLMPGTSRSLGVGNSFDPAQNIEAGVRYLKQLQELYKDDRLALAAYNAGPKAVERYRQIPPYAETQNYVEQVGRRYRAARKAAQEKESAEQAQKAAEPAPLPKQPKVEQFFDQDGRLSLRTIFE
jgi:hypothetical protein